MKSLELYLLIVWLPVFVLFLGLIIGEARKREVRINWKHVLVALFWPIWGLWYLFVLIKDRLQ